MSVLIELIGGFNCYLDLVAPIWIGSLAD